MVSASVIVSTVIAWPATDVVRVTWPRSVRQFISPSPCALKVRELFGVE